MICSNQSVIFLGILLVLGAIAILFPSAQALPYYEDNRYDPAYPSEYTNNNSYEPKYLTYTQDYNPDYQSYEDNNY
jgi:hypothetical protein